VPRPFKKDEETKMSEPLNGAMGKEATSAQTLVSEEHQPERPAVCRLLRTKHAFGTFRGNLYSWQAGASTTAVYWCLNTMETAGPDDGYAHPHQCRAGRSCFEEPIE
jgi:hypothetical protein